MVGTTNEEFTCRVCVVEVTVDDDVWRCGDVLRARAARVGAFVVVTRGTIIYDGNSKLI